MVVSPALPDRLRGLVEKHKLRFDILHDPSNQVAASYGLVWEFPNDLRQLYLQFGLDIAAVNGDDSWTLPIPARYIVDRDGVVRYARSDPDYTRRPEPEETLEALRALAG